MFCKNNVFEPILCAMQLAILKGCAQSRTCVRGVWCVRGARGTCVRVVSKALVQTYLF